MKEMQGYLEVSPGGPPRNGVESFGTAQQYLIAISCPLLVCVCVCMAISESVWSISQPELLHNSAHLHSNVLHVHVPTTLLIVS